MLLDGNVTSEPDNIDLYSSYQEGPSSRPHYTKDISDAPRMFCLRDNDKKVSTVCQNCNKPVCKAHCHSSILCSVCS